jgi:RNA polymerase sigma-70 factor, ECF subfamily
MLSRPKAFSWPWQSREEVDFEVLYQTELPRIYNFFRFRVGDGPVAEDLTSATFEKAWRNRHRYRHDQAAFSTWLFTIARRVATDHYRKKRPELSLDELPELAVPEITEELVQNNADHDRLALLLSRLAERDRELVALKYGAGLTNRTIAGLTGISESHVGTILHRTIVKLRAEWENRDE